MDGGRSNSKKINVINTHFATLFYQLFVIDCFNINYIAIIIFIFIL